MHDDPIVLVMGSAKWLNIKNSIQDVSMTKVLVIALFCLSCFAAVDPAEILLNSYRSQCPNVANITSGAQSLLSTFKGAIAQIRSKENCSGVMSDYNSLYNFEKTYTNYEIYRNYKLDKEQKERLIADYTYFLAQNQLNLSAEEISYLQAEIFNNQASIVALDSDIIRFENMGQGFEQGASSFALSFNDLLNSINDSQECLDKSSSLYGTLIGSGLSIASLFASPANSLYLATSSSVTRSMSKFFQDVKYTKLANDADSILWPEAIRCASEAMTVNYCSAQRSINLFEKYLEDQSEDRVLFEGVDLLNYHLKGLDEWLVQVFAGSPITSSGDLTDRDKPIAQYELLGRVNRYLQAYKRIKDDEIKISVGDINAVHNAIYGAMVGLTGIMNKPDSLEPSTTEGNSPCYGSNCGPAIANPIFTARTKTYLLFELFGFNEIPKECNSTSGGLAVCGSFIDYLNTKGVKLNLTDWDNAYANAQDIVAKTLKQVNVQRARTISFDPIGLFVLARRRFNNKPNAIEGLKEAYKNGVRIKKYLIKTGCEDEPEFCEDGLPTWLNSYSLQIESVEETIKITSQVLDLIKEAANPRSLGLVELPEVCSKSSDTTLGQLGLLDARKEKAFALSTCITELLQLAERGNDIYFSKLRTMVSMELETRLAHGDFDNKMSDVLMATRDDLVDRLTRSLTLGGNSSIGQVLTGLESSKDISRETINLFFEKFSKKITDVFSKNNMSSRVKSEMCFRVIPFLSDDTKSRKFIHKIYDSCKNEKMVEFKQGPEIFWADYVTKDSGSTKIYPYSVKKEKSDMVCVLDDFFTHNRLYREKLKGSSRRR
jgi:hypothetical protein